MLHLTAAALVWAFSFGLIKDRLAAVDPSVVAAVRLLLSLLVFLPFLRPAVLPRGLRLRLIAVGAMQYGVMYLAYLAAFRYLQAFEVALLTVFTPVYVTLIHDLFERRLERLNLFTAGLTVLGTGIVCYGEPGRSGLLEGALLVQLSNLCFAFGQVAYRRWLPPAVKDRQVFALLYLGGTGVAGAWATLVVDWARLSLGRSELLTLLYLGVVASGLAFFVWNAGARRVEVGTLAIFNDLKIPLAIAVSMLCFGERASLPRLLLGGALVLAALGLQERARRGAREKS